MLYDVRIITKSPVDKFLGMYPVIKRHMTAFINHDILYFTFYISLGLVLNAFKALESVQG